MAYSDADRLLTVRGTLTYPDTGTQALTSAHISSFLVNEDAGRDVPVGAAPAASFELKLDNSSGQWEPGGSILGAHVLDGAKVEIEIGLWNGTTYDYSDIGTYYVDDVQGQEHETLIRLKGSDAMVSLMSEYYADGAGDYPQTLSSLLTDIAAAAGVTLESSTFTNSTVSIPAQPAWKNNLTCREAVGYIAACAGGIARFNRAGKLEIVTLEKVSSRAVSTSVYKTIQKGDTFFGGLNAINVYAYGAPDGTSPSRYATTPAMPDTSLNSINIRDNPILAYGSTALAALGAGMLSALTGLAFRGATFEWHGDPAVELGELCTVTDLSSTAIPILITKQTLRFTSGFSMNSGCAVTTSTKADASGKLQKIFTPTGNLNAEALAGNIYVKAGEKMTLESGGIMNVLSGGEMNIASGGKLKLASGNDVDIGADTLADLLAAATSQTTIWYQDNQPTATATGDIWYDTDASPVTIKRWNGSSWVDITTTALSQALTAAGTAQATADGKIKAWAQKTAPSATAVGDLWIDTDDNNKLYRATAAGTGNWVLYKVAAGYVSTSHITIDNDSIDIVSGGTLTLNAADDIKIGSGSGTLASTIDLSANNSIKLAVSGGTNLLTGTSAELRNVSVSQYTGTVQANLVYADLGLATNDSITFRVYLKAINKPLRARISQYRADATYDSVTGNLIPLGSEGFSTVTTKVGADKVKCSCLIQNGDTATYTTTTTEQYKWAKFERGTMATDWSPSPYDPVSGVKTSYIDIATDHIDISSGGNLSITSPNTLKITSGTTNATALAVRNDTDYFISAGHLTQSSAPFWVKKDGSIKATSGTIGGFTIGTNSLSAQATGKPLLKLDAANSEIILGGLKLFYSGSSEYEFNVGTDELHITASYFGVVGANVFFDVMDGYAWCNGNMSAKSFTDRTPAYTGKNAVAELKLVRNDKNGNIDHSTLPAFARKKITSKDKKGKESEADGRDLGAMISILTKAVQELDERLERIENERV